MPAFELTNISKRFGPAAVLDGVGLSAESGVVHALIGENRASKSTLMRILSGVLRPDRGWMELDGKLYSPVNPDSGRRAGVSMIYQELTLAPHLTAAENIVLGRETSRLGWVSSSIRQRIAERVLAQLGHETLPLDKPVASLTTAEQQIVEIARALAGDPRILILDEPTPAA